MRTRIVLSSLAVAALLGGIQCHDPEGVAVGSVTVSPASVEVPVGQSVQLQATVWNRDGRAVSAFVEWSSGDLGRAIVTPSGSVTVLAEGQVVITATAGGVSGAAVVTGSSLGTVLAAVATVTVTPATWTRLVGDTIRLTAILKDAAGNVLTGRIVTWASSNLAVARVDSSGLVTAVGPGSVTVSASSEGKTSGMSPSTVGPFRRVTVEPASTYDGRLCMGDGPLQLRATVRDSEGTVVNRPVQWWSSAGGAEVDGSGKVSRPVGILSADVDSNGVLSNVVIGPSKGFGYVVIVATDGAPVVPLGNTTTDSLGVRSDDAPGVPSDTAWLVLAGLFWPNEPEQDGTEGLTC